MKIGEIYFIRERDRVDGGASSYVKIGMVNDVTRDSAERLRQHQTGNPRDLTLHHVTQTPGPFRVERFLHQHLGPHRVRSEWFSLTEHELDRAVQLAEQLAAEAFIFIPIIERAETLGGIESTEPKRAATEESTRWLTSLSTAKVALKVCKMMSDEYRSVAVDLPDDLREEVEHEELVVTEHYIDKRFDADGFARRYPDLATTHTEIVTSISGRFSPTLLPIELGEIDAPLDAFASDFHKACADVRGGNSGFGELFDLRQQLEQFAGAYRWEQDIADAQLRVICGSASGIEGQVTWNRTRKDVPSLDEERLESLHPVEFNEFVTLSTKTRLKTRRRARKKTNE